ncbi:nitrile hydratase subunit alpha [Pseudooceanicola sp. GBMRC 2024]|uniref:nitrile hydratase n=1 Tax=Pseudooceanicola albus TaxID=2692189 RepID=A0A6L7G0J5_9RHOB|nr:nitrile hydratase subunit alpha [Pseudooceanicola albus]MXN17854.1 nitrile hydratase subunit alpha [Pseudooceanicola albus]
MSDHDHDHDHHHGTKPPSDKALRVRAIEQLLTEKGLIREGAVDAIIDIFEHKLGPKNGARVVARAWSDPAYKARLMENASDAILEFGFSGFQGEYMVVCENTETAHNVVVCTLCSCYPWPVLGLPPNWYKTAPYRSRVVIEPRKVLEEFGTHIPDEVEVRVWDSNNELRYLVLPMRPEGTEGWSEEKLAQLVTRDSMIGTGLPLTPAQLEEMA